VTLTSRRRAELRTAAHHLAASVHVGQHGVTPAVVQSLDDALRTRELVKVHLARESDMKPRAAVLALADAVGADVVQVIGRTTTLYRENPELHEEKLPGAARRKG